MNIFYIDKDPHKAAQAMTDKHVIKMILESAQLLSTAHHVLGSNTKEYLEALYRPTHINHPSAIWVRESLANYKWLYNHFMSLCEEYTERYGKIHLTEKKLALLLCHTPKDIPNIGLTPMRIAIKDTCWHKDDAIESYRAYYVGEKLKNEKDIKRYNKIIKGEWLC